MTLTLNNLLEIAENLKYEKLFVNNEKQCLQILNLQVEEQIEKLCHVAWAMQYLRMNIDNLILAKSDISLMACCNKINILNHVRFLDGHKRLGHCVTLFSELFKIIRENPKYLASCLLIADQHSFKDAYTISYIIVSAVYCNCLLRQDEDYIINLLKYLMDAQLVTSEFPRKLLRHGSCSFSRIYKMFTERLYSAKLFLICSLNESILNVLMEEYYLDIDTYISEEQEQLMNKNQKNFEDTVLCTFKMPNRKYILDKLVKLTKMFIQGIKDSMFCFPQSILQLIQYAHDTLIAYNKFEIKIINAYCIDLMFAIFICPAIVNPELSGLVYDIPINNVARFNLIQVAQILQMLALQTFENVDSKFSCLISYFGIDCLDSIFEVILGSTNSNAFYNASLQELCCSAALISLKDIKILVDFFLFVNEHHNGEEIIKKEIDEKIQKLSSYNILNNLMQNSENCFKSFNVSSSNKKNNIIKDSNMLNIFQEAHYEMDILVIPIGSVTYEHLGMLSEQKVVSLNRELHQTHLEPIIANSMPRDNNIDATIANKKTRFFLSQDENSLGNVSDNLEVVSEAASNNSLSLSVDLENEDKDDNLSELISGRESPNISGLDTPSSHITEGEDSVSRHQVDSRQISHHQQYNKHSRPTDIEDRFCKFEITSHLEKKVDETVSLISDTWSMDVLASDSETVEPTPCSLIDVSENLETASSWSTDVLISDSDRLGDLDTDDANSVFTARSDEVGRIEVAMDTECDSLHDNKCENSKIKGFDEKYICQQTRNYRSAEEPVNKDSCMSEKMNHFTSTNNFENVNLCSNALNLDKEITEPREYISNFFEYSSHSFSNSWKNNAKQKKGFFRWKLPFKNMQHKTVPNKLSNNEHQLYTNIKSSDVNTFRYEVSDNLGCHTDIDGSEYILDKYRKKAVNLHHNDFNSQQNLKCNDDDENIVESHEIEESLIFTDAKKKLRLVLSNADIQLFQLTANLSEDKKRITHNKLMSFLHLQSAVFSSLNDHPSVVQLNETQRCLQNFDDKICIELIQALSSDYYKRSAYITYLIKCKQKLLNITKYLERLIEQVEQERQLCVHFLLSMSVRHFLDKHEQNLLSFTNEFLKISTSDEKAMYVEAFLNNLWQEAKQNNIWKCKNLKFYILTKSLVINNKQMDIVFLEIERFVMNRIYFYALYPNGEGDLQRDEVLHEHINCLSSVLTPNHKDLSIPHFYLKECPWPTAQAEILRMAIFKTPKDKLNCVLQCCNVIMNILSLADEKSIPTVDHLIPILVYILVKANPSHLLSTIQYVNSLYEHRMDGEENYWWTQFCAAVQFIKTMNY